MFVFKDFVKAVTSYLSSVFLALVGFDVAFAEWITLDEVNPASAIAKSKWVALEPRPKTSEIDEKPDELPNFSSFTRVEEKKQKFFAFMLPKIREANHKIRNERKTAKRISRSFFSDSDMTEEDLSEIKRLRSKYKVNPQSNIQDALEALIIKVDEVPASLVLAQSANESGWGTSRFATQAKNMFGIWCFRKGCGITPLKRAAGEIYEVAKYNSIQESVEAYMLNINSHRAYQDLRNIRSALRADNGHLSGMTLAEGLETYSARGLKYVEEIKQLIRTNKLQRFNSEDKA